MTGAIAIAYLRGEASPAIGDALAEFERLDASAPHGQQGRPAWSFEGEPLTARKRRWLELYRKLESSKRPAKTHGRRR